MVTDQDRARFLAELYQQAIYLEPGEAKRHLEGRARLLLGAGDDADEDVHQSIARIRASVDSLTGASISTIVLRTS